jgi:hypothetical protein
MLCDLRLQYFLIFIYLIVEAGADCVVIRDVPIDNIRACQAITMEFRFGPPVLFCFVAWRILVGAK